MEIGAKLKLKLWCSKWSMCWKGLAFHRKVWKW